MAKNELKLLCIVRLELLGCTGATLGWLCDEGHSAARIQATLVGLVPCEDLLADEVLHFSC